jgi:hypothetical protein
MQVPESTAGRARVFWMMGLFAFGLLSLACETDPTPTSGTDGLAPSTGFTGRSFLATFHRDGAERGAPVSVYTRPHMIGAALRPGRRE